MRHGGDCGVFSVRCAAGVCVLWLLLSAILASGGCNRSEMVTTGRVTGNSMEPTFAGERAYFDCRTCGLESFFSPLPSSDEPLYCPRCHAEISMTRQEIGQLVRYQTVPLATHLCVGDVIVFDPEKTSDASDIFGLQIKRISALPEQKLAIKGGDLWINGNRQQGSSDQFSARAVTVDRAAFQTETKAEDWIVYFPASMYPRHGARFERHSSWILDESPWDIHESRKLVRVDDFGIEFDFDKAIDLSLEFDVELKLQSGDREIGIQMTRESLNGVRVKCTIHQSETQRSQSFRLKCEAIEKMQVAVFDGNLRIKLDDVEGAVALPDSSSQADATPTNDGEEGAHFGFVKTNVLPASDLKWVIAFKVHAAEPTDYHVVLKRDIYYRGPRGELEYDLPAVKGYQVLGDHVAASVDSRQGYPNGIPLSAIIGRIQSVDCH